MEDEIKNIEFKIKKYKKWSEVILFYKSDYFDAETCANTLSITKDEFLKYVNCPK